MRLPVLLSCLSLLLVPAMPGAPVPVDRPWADEVIYFVITDRFLDGDPANNIPPGSDPTLYDATKTDLNRYHGGDLRGLEQAIESGYFERLGVTALWLTPPVRNTWFSPHDLGGAKTGYHGYWARDFLDIDPHLASRARPDGTPYPDNRDGRLLHYRDFIALAHRHGLRVVQDVVLNHAGVVFYYDADNNQRFDRGNAREWIQPFRPDGPYPNARWTDVPEWGLGPPAPAAPVQALGRTVSVTGALARLESFGRRGFSPDSLGKQNGEEVACDFLSLRDFNTDPASPAFRDLVHDFVEIHAFYIETLGVDGLRIDTIKHAHPEFWDAFTDGLRRRLGTERARRTLCFGEVYDGNPATLGRYTYRSDWPRNPAPALDSVLDFQFCFAVREFLRKPGQPFGRPQAIEDALKARLGGRDTGRGRPFYNQSPACDGQPSRDLLVSFVENHDGLNRFRVQGIDERTNLLAQALLLACPGIPCLYYGTEAGLQDTAAQPWQDAESGRMTLFQGPGGRTPAAVESGDSFRTLAALLRLRHDLPALRRGAWVPLWCDDPSAPADDGTLAFARTLPGPGGQSVLVVANAGPNQARPGNDGLLPTGPLPVPAAPVPALAIPGWPVPPPAEPGPTGNSLRVVVPPRSVAFFLIGGPNLTPNR